MGDRDKGGDQQYQLGYIEKGEKIKVIRDEAGQLYVIKA